MSDKTQISRSTKGLRDHLFDILDQLASGKITPQNAMTVTKVAQQIHNTARLEIDAARFVSEQRAASGDGGALTLKALEFGG